MTKNRLRFPLFDSIRGFALVIMAVYHFSFDLNQFGVLHENMNHDPFWLNFRAVIMSLFLSLVGVGLSLAPAAGSAPERRRRLLKIAACAALISLVSYWMNPQSWIYFGVLHFIFVASLLGPWLARWPRFSLLAGIAIVLTPLFYRSLFFFRPGWILTGLSPIKPMTEDFAPFFPWLGVVMLGVFVGWQVQMRKPQWARNIHWPWLSRLGRHSLLFYMTHQLVLFPLAWLISQI